MAEAKTNTMVKKHMIGLFLDTSATESEEYTRVAKSTELTIEMNGETEEYDYIVDEMPTTELMYYKPSIETPLTMYTDDPMFTYIFGKFYNLEVGTQTGTTAMLVFMFDGNKETGYKAWKVPASIVITDLNAVDSTITFTIEFGGTVQRGTATMQEGKPTFTPSPEAVSLAEKGSIKIEK